MQNTITTRNFASDLHIARLDTIRFLAALWVAIFHGAIPLKPLADHGFIRLGLAFVQDSFDGSAAVIVFFIISGLCIHLPYSGKRGVPLLSFLVRRYLRVGLPLILILIAANFVGPESKELLRGVTWSVYAELFYYSIYPYLFRIAYRWGWMPQIATSSIIAIAISFWFVSKTHVINQGLAVWFWGLPIWISGCLMAEWFRSGCFPRLPGSLWVWRVVAWIVSVEATWLVFHSPVKVGYQFSMLVFAPVAFVWLVKELSSRIEAWSLLERCGAASYSLYLVHPVVLGGLAQHVPVVSAPTNLFLRVSVVAIMTAAFHFAVEAPSHRLARILSRVVGSFGVGRWKSGASRHFIGQRASNSHRLVSATAIAGILSLLMIMSSGTACR